MKSKLKNNIIFRVGLALVLLGQFFVIAQLVETHSGWLLVIVSLGAIYYLVALNEDWDI